MALLYWYILPIGIELGFDSRVLLNFSTLAESIEFAMTMQPRTSEEVDKLQGKINDFLWGFEQLYVNGNPEKIHRCRYCIFQLVHVPQHIRWNGSVRLGSQAVTELSVGVIQHNVVSWKSPFANMANIIFERQVFRILKISLPSLFIQDTAAQKTPSILNGSYPKLKKPPGPPDWLAGPTGAKLASCVIAPSSKPGLAASPVGCLCMFEMCSVCSLFPHFCA